MAFIYKTFLRNENWQYILWQDRVNSRKYSICRTNPKKKVFEETIAEVDNKNRKITWIVDINDKLKERIEQALPL